MWDYSDKVMDHFRNPRNVGKIEGPDGVGTVGSLACGDALTLMFKLGPDKRIAEVKFQTFGCAECDCLLVGLDRDGDRKNHRGSRTHHQ